MAGGVNAIGNLLGKVNANNALVVTLDGGSASATTLTVDTLTFNIANPDVSVTRGAAKLLSSDSSMTIVRGVITSALPVQTDTVTWNNAGVNFVGWQLDVTDTASGASSNLMSLRVGGGNVFAVNKTGEVTSSGAGNFSGRISTPLIGFNSDTRDRLNSPADGLFNVRDSSETVGLQFNNGTAAPTFNNGTVVTGSRNSAGQITLTGGNTGGTVTFGAPNWTNTPFVVVTGAAATDVPHVTATSATAFTVAGLTANGTFSYHCIGRI